MPGFCPLSLLFSDWDRSGRRDLRVTNDRQYYPPQEGEDQLWRVEPGQAPVAWTHEEGWQKRAARGHGHRQRRHHRRRLSRVLPLEHGRQQAHDAGRRAERPGLPRTSRCDRGVDAAQPVAGGEHLPSTSWHAEFDDVNNDGLARPVRGQGQRRGHARARHEGPQRALPGHARRHLRASRQGRRHPALRPHAGRRPGRPQPGRPPRPRGGQPARTGPALAQRGRRDGSKADRRWVTGSPWSWPSRHRTRMPSAPGSRSSEAGRPSVREVTVGGGHAGGQLGPIHFGLGSADEARVRVTWPDGEVGDWMDVARPTSDCASSGAATSRSALPDPEG